MRRRGRIERCSVLVEPDRARVGNGKLVDVAPSAPTRRTGRDLRPMRPSIQRSDERQVSLATREKTEWLNHIRTLTWLM